jgi:hypothetical protein
MPKVSENVSSSDMREMMWRLSSPWRCLCPLSKLLPVRPLPIGEERPHRAQNRTLGDVTREVRVRAAQSALLGKVDQSPVVLAPVRTLSERRVASPAGKSVPVLCPPGTRSLDFCLFFFLSTMMREAIPSSASNHCSYLKLFWRTRISMASLQISQYSFSVRFLNGCDYSLLWSRLLRF